MTGAGFGGAAGAPDAARPWEVGFGVSSAGRITQVPAPAAAANMMANDVITTGRFRRGRFGEAGAVAGLPVIPGE
jgi:hypothetical protein